MLLLHFVVSSCDSWQNSAFLKFPVENSCSCILCHAFNFATFSYTLNYKQVPLEEILLYTLDTNAIREEIQSTGERITVQLGDNLVIAKVSPTQQNLTSASTSIPHVLSDEAHTFVKVYRKYREDLEKPQPETRRWDELSAPMVLLKEPPHPLMAGAASPYASTMTGKIVIVVLMSSGPGSLEITSSEETTILSEVTTALDWWSTTAPASAELSFVILKGLASISASDSTYCSSCPACHKQFRDQTLRYFDYSTGEIGLDELAQASKDYTGAEGAVIAFFTHYRLCHFGYAYFGGGPIYMDYNNGNWGTDQIDRVFAHELGHTFNAPDEYTQCDCYKQYGQGSCTARNDNCLACSYSQTDCIMNTNSFAICSYSRKHVGWCWMAWTLTSELPSK